MKKYIIIVEVYDQENTDTYPLGGVFDTQKDAVDYMNAHLKEVKSQHWTNFKDIEMNGYEEKYVTDSYFLAKDVYDGQSLEVSVREVPVMTKEFPCVHVMRDDLDWKGFKAMDLPDDTMESVANKIGSYLLEEIPYWDAVECAAEDCDISRKED